MVNDQLYHKKQKDLARKRANRSIKKYILIVCEGKKTEPNYFKSFKITSAEIKIRGTGYNTKSLVAYAQECEKVANKQGLSYDQVWCVFDKDCFLKSEFKNAIKKAKALGFNVAYSNECFELWYLLHFEYLTSGLNRTRYFEKLKEHLGEDYKKNSKDMYDKLLEKQGIAIKNAKKLLGIYSKEQHPADCNPSTTVYLLVEELNRYL